MARDFYNQRWVSKLWIVGLGQRNMSESWAITLGQYTFYTVAKDDVNPIWRAHEDYHKHQWRRDGLIKFALKYAWYNITRGYWRNPYEIEANGQSNNGLL